MLVGRHRLGAATRADPEVLEHAERLARRPPELGVVALGLELGEHDERDHHVVLVEALQAEGSASNTDVSST